MLQLEMQSLAQAGLFYCKDNYGLERYERFREISAEMASLQTDREQIEMCFQAMRSEETLYD